MYNYDWDGQRTTKHFLHNGKFLCFYQCRKPQRNLQRKQQREFPVKIIKLEISLFLVLILPKDRFIIHHCLEWGQIFASQILSFKTAHEQKNKKSKEKGKRKFLTRHCQWGSIHQSLIQSVSQLTHFKIRAATVNIGTNNSNGNYI